MCGQEALTAEMDPMELRNVNIEPDDESISGESVQDGYTGMGNLEKAAMSRYGVKDDQVPWKNERFVDVRNNVFQFITYLRDNNDIDVNTSTF